MQFPNVSYNETKDIKNNAEILNKNYLRLIEIVKHGYFIAQWCLYFTVYNVYKELKESLRDKTQEYNWDNKISLQ